MFKAIRIIFRTFLLLILLIICIACYARYIEPARLTVHEITMLHETAPGDFQDMKVAIFSDTHFSRYYTLESFEKARSAINGANPDIILFCGDLIDNYEEYDGDIEEISASLSTLNAKYGKFAVFGNHDYGGSAYKVYRQIMEDGGFTVLVNESIEFPDQNMSLTGLDDFLLGQANIEAASFGKENSFNLVFAHEPDIVDQLASYHVNFMTAGHTHGGQINLLGLKHIFFPPYGQKYLKGAYRLENSRNTFLYVNPGLGTTKLPFRFMAIPEVTILTIKK